MLSRDKSNAVKTWVWLIVAAIAVMPFTVTSIPPLMDLPGHMARFHIMQALPSSSDLQLYYNFDWQLLGNLGVDLFVYSLKDILSVQRATWLACLITILLSVYAIYRLSLITHGVVQPTAFLALPFIYSYFFQYGFLNYALSMPLALLALSFWIERPDKPLQSFLIFGCVSLLLWLCHTLGWGLFAFCAGIISLHTLIIKYGWRPTELLRRGTLDILPLSLPLILTIILRSKEAGGVTKYTDTFLYEKVSFFAKALRDQVFLLDLASLALLISLPIIWLLMRKARLSYPLAWAAGSLALFYCLMPSVIFGSQYADGRLVAAIAILALASVKWTGTQRAAQMIISAALLLFTLRVALTTNAWANADKRVTSHLKATNFVPRGSRILALVHLTCGNAKAPLDFSRTHLPEMMVIRQDAFVNALWQVSGAQSLNIRYNLDTNFASDPSQYVFSGDCDKQGRTMESKLSAFPRDRFDFVWIIDPPITVKLQNYGLEPIYSDSNTALLRIKK